MENMLLNNGLSMPKIGIGTFLLKPEEAEQAVLWALENGYRSVDTANVYFNEKAVGRAIKKSGVPREEIFLTSKIWPSTFKYEKAKKAIDDTLARLGVDYLDCLILHQAAGKYLEAYRAIEEAVEEGKVRSIGLSNFYGKAFEKVLANAKIKPVLDTLECNPICQQDKMRERLAKENMILESWYPLGGKGNKSIAENPIFVELAKKYGKTPYQVILRWHLDMGYIIIPGSKSESHIKQNLDILDFSLTKEEMAQIAALNKEKQRLGLNGFIRALIPLAKSNYDKQA